MKIPTQKTQICVGIFFSTLYIFTKTHFFYFIRKLFSFCAKSNNEIVRELNPTSVTEFFENLRGQVKEYFSE